MLTLRRRPRIAAAVLALACILPGAAHGAASELVDVNHASLQELLRLPGITEVWARRIIHFRPYHSKLDLLNEGVVSASVYAHIRDCVVAHRISAHP